MFQGKGGKLCVCACACVRVCLLCVQFSLASLTHITQHHTPVTHHPSSTSTFLPTGSNRVLQRPWATKWCLRREGWKQSSLCGNDDGGVMEIMMMIMKAEVEKTDKQVKTR